MKKPHIFLLLIAVFFVGVGGAWAFQILHAEQGGVQATKESTYDRVMRTQTIRCGYIDWPPFLKKDPNSGHLTGIFYDYVEALAKSLHLKIEWAEEVGWSDFPAALNSGRIDAMCSGSFSNPARARVIDFLRPIGYLPMYAYARTDDKRFDNNIDSINSPDVTIVTVEGATGSVVAAQDFPKAKSVQLPEMTNIADTIVSLVDGKADIALVPPTIFVDYSKNNPGKVHQVVAKMPLRVFATGVALAASQDRFRRMLDFATEEMLSSGQIEKIIEKYDVSSDTLLRVVPSYKEPNP